MVASWQSAFAPWTANILFIISENADRVDYLYGEGEEGRFEKKGLHDHQETGFSGVSGLVAQLVRAAVM